MLKAKLWALRPAARCVHTRPKKVTVQSLKDIRGKRFKGEVFDVSEGHMRLKLHPEGTAAYLLKNEQPPLPVLSAQEVQRLRKESQLRARAHADRAAERAKQVRAPSPSQAQDTKVRSLIDALNFPTQSQSRPDSAGDANAAAAPASPEAPASAKEPSKKKFAWQNDFVVNITDKK